MTPDAFWPVLRNHRGHWIWCVINIAGRVIAICDDMTHAAREAMRRNRLQMLKDIHEDIIVQRTVQECIEEGLEMRTVKRNPKMVTQARGRHTVSSWWKR